MHVKPRFLAIVMVFGVVAVLSIGSAVAGQHDEHLAEVYVVQSDDDERSSKAWLGVSVEEETEHPDGGARVTWVIDDSPAAQIGLAPDGVFQVPTPKPVNDNVSAPGEGPLQERPYVLAPPVISHGVADFLPITADDNMCAMCHGVGEKEEGGPTPMPESHYVDLRRESGKVGSEVAGARYNCLACHATMTDALPLVANDMKEMK